MEIRETLEIVEFDKKSLVLKCASIGGFDRLVTEYKFLKRGVCNIYLNQCVFTRNELRRQQ